MNSSVKKIFARPVGIAFLMAGVALGARGVENDFHSAQFSAVAAAPLYFERNAGQIENDAPFVARGAECSVLLAPTEADILLGKSSGQSIVHTPTTARTVRLQLMGANPDAQVTGCDQLSASANYFIGDQRSQWRAGIPLFAKVRVNDVYPGVRVIYYGNQSAQLEYDFLLQPGAAADQIRFRITGADGVRVDESGNLALNIGGEEIQQHKPVACQENAGARKEIPVAYRLNADGTVSFTLAAYDHSLPLTIDPALDFVTYMGGRKMDIGHAIALDPSGNVYVAGETLSTGLLTTNSIEFGVTNFSKFRGGNNAFGDAFVAKYDNSGVLQFLTYLGGKNDDGALGIAFDNSVNGPAVWVAGFTDSTNFPLVNPIDPQLTGPTKNAKHVPAVDAFVSKLDPTGANLLFSSYFGGDNIDEGTGIAVDPQGSVYLTGLTSSTNLAVTPNAFQPTNSGAFDAFVTRLSGSGNIYSNSYTTYLGGTNEELGLAIAVDSSLDAWVTGLTFSTNFPTVNALQLAAGVNFYYTNNYSFTNLNTQTTAPRHDFRGDFSDAFVTEVLPDGTVPFSSYLGGSNDDVGESIAIDGSDNVYVAGYTSSRNFPTNIITAQTTNFLGYDPATVVFPTVSTNFQSHAFVTEISTHPAPALLASTRFGGNLADQARAVAVDQNGLVYVTGSASSTNFFATNMLVLTNSVIVTNRHSIDWPGFSVPNPAFTNLSSTNMPVKLRHAGNTNDVFVAVLAPGLSSFVHSISLGGPGRDEANGIAVDPSGNAVYLVGTTTSTTNFVTTNAAQPDFSGVRGKSKGKAKISDAFVGKILLVP
ncbi:MAG TPA: SBBP repeat-containing protein [Candidatus Angelobacter sp.]|nr:SBBP repeat-containing protein [Candidatus Angelobacter sp.]